MGLTHYWTLATLKADFEDTIKDMRKIMEGKGARSQFSDNHAVIQGHGETFVFPGQVGFNFCKTGRDYEYGDCVMACLMAAKYHLEDKIKVSSDNRYVDKLPTVEEAWQRRRESEKEKFGHYFSPAEPDGRFKLDFEHYNRDEWESAKWIYRKATGREPFDPTDKENE